jgi:hypothetical protein
MVGILLSLRKANSAQQVPRTTSQYHIYSDHCSVSMLSMQESSSSREYTEVVKFALEDISPFRSGSSWRAAYEGSSI